MDVLIKNIGGLPEDGDLTLTINPKGQVILGGCIFTSNFGKEVNAVALPEHGDLIDRNKLPIIGITDYKLESHTVVEFEDVLNTPVIVEATE